MADIEQYQGETQEYLEELKKWEAIPAEKETVLNEQEVGLKG